MDGPSALGGRCWAVFLGGLGAGEKRHTCTKTSLTLSYYVFFFEWGMKNMVPQSRSRLFFLCLVNPRGCFLLGHSWKFTHVFKGVPQKPGKPILWLVAKSASRTTGQESWFMIRFPNTNTTTSLMVSRFMVDAQPSTVRMFMLCLGGFKSRPFWPI